MNCIVCNNQSAESFQTSDTKTYWKCGYCLAKFLDPGLYIEVGIEKERYLEHDNRIDDEAYRSFLSRLANPLQKKLFVDDTGLDFGCGHGPALADMLQAEGFQIDLYDPFFFPDKKVFTKKYNFITCTETAEHFHHPHAGFAITSVLILGSIFSSELDLILLIFIIHLVQQALLVFTSLSRSLTPYLLQ